jgi:hypothetical protein
LIIGRVTVPSCNWTLEAEITLAGVGWPVVFDAVCGICWVFWGFCALTGEVLLGIGIGVFASKIVADILRSEMRGS